MRRFTLSVIVAAAFTISATAAAIKASPYVGALAIDAKDGRVLFSRNAGAKAYPASVTKLMTAYIVLDEVAKGSFSLSDVVTASPVMSEKEKWERMPSCTGLKAGEQMTVEELLESLMVKSANDAAVFLAEKCSGSVEAFVARMNEKAKSLGMKDTRYFNPNGLPPWPKKKELANDFNVSTCNDIAKLCKSLLAVHPEILKWTSLKTWHPTCVGKNMKDKNGSNVKWVNHNDVMVKNKFKVINPDGTEAVDGLKTGYINAGGSSVALTGKNGKNRAIVVVLGSNSSTERNDAARKIMTDALNALSM